MEFKRTKQPRRECTKHPAHRPCIAGTKVDAEQIKKLIQEGWTDKKILDFLGVSEVTWQEWKKNHPELIKLQDWRKEFDDKIVRSLAELAVGYSHPEEKIFLGPGGSIVTYETTKQYPPHEGAIKYWLNNRKRGEWSNQQELALMGKHGGAIQLETRPKQICLDDFTEEELAMLIAAGKKLNVKEEEEEEEEE